MWRYHELNAVNIPENTDDKTHFSANDFTFNYGLDL